MHLVIAGLTKVVEKKKSFFNKHQYSLPVTWTCSRWVHLQKEALVRYKQNCILFLKHKSSRVTWTCTQWVHLQKEALVRYNTALHFICKAHAVFRNCNNSTKYSNIARNLAKPIQLTSQIPTAGSCYLHWINLLLGNEESNFRDNMMTTTFDYLVELLNRPLIELVDKKNNNKTTAKALKPGHVMPV